MAWSNRLVAHLAAAVASALLAPLAGCGAFDRSVPDEFAVTTRAPLVIPNDFSLPPPRPGAERAQEQPPRLQAEAALVPEVALSGASGPDSPGQQALLRAAGRAAPANIRQLIDREAKGGTGTGIADTLLFWNAPAPPGAALDPQHEAARLRQRGAAPAVPAGGSAPAPTSAKSKSSGPFDWLF